MSSPENVINFRRRIKTALVSAFGNKCVICGQEYPECVFDFHHLDPSMKSFRISTSITKSKEGYAEEAEKCCLLCANCHRKLENGLADASELRCTFNREVYYQTIIDLSKRKPSQEVKPVNSSRPDRETLKQLIRSTPFVKIGQQFLVSDNAVRKWCVKYGLPSKVSEIKHISDLDWNAI